MRVQNVVFRPSELKTLQYNVVLLCHQEKRICKVSLFFRMFSKTFSFTKRCSLRSFKSLPSGVPKGGMGGSGPPTFQKVGPRDSHKNVIKLVGGGGIRPIGQICQEVVSEILE